MTLFTQERGKVDAVAKGVRRARSHLAGRLEFANECEFSMHHGRSLDVIVSAEILHAPWSQLVEPERYAAASVVAELIDSFCEPELALPDVYALLSAGIGAIATSSSPCALLPRFSLRLLDMLGLAPPLTTCARCGSQLIAGPAWLDAEAGGIIDAACRERWRDLRELTERDVENLRVLSAPKADAAIVALHATPDAAAAVDDLVAYHLGRRPRAAAHLGTLAT